MRHRRLIVNVTVHRATARAAAALRILWASPCSLVGIALAFPVLAAGGTARRVGPALEVVVHRDALPSRSPLRRLPFAAITFGHVVVALSGRQLAVLRAHEHVHVRQYEVLGALFFPAYALASLVALARGRSAYAGNAFEVQACRKCGSAGVPDV
jgi:hypothetical protein